jgi:hypothetical protein
MHHTTAATASPRCATPGCHRPVAITLVAGHTAGPRCLSRRCARPARPSSPAATFRHGHALHLIAIPRRAARTSTPPSTRRRARAPGNHPVPAPATPTDDQPARMVPD